MAEQRSEAQEVVDMELECVKCHTPLYVPLAQIDAILASLTRTGAAILICVCGQAQLIHSQHRPRHD